ncbi:16S rRNA (guanine(966)-N(2))-methyltransferase RsmD [Polymorphobacter fuscus]|uniref:16S rRNA (Guanine(966)-N(2))-methyltransferase RsmD n=1 Tax=Sandarakinorhabdus fusca TaxID=1439888 RepID=A0A7C9GTA2_9SPHN|nr:16S rRNA (guanine(966)-N(2))-methyltransferase RsmD [Polymorphobacter fuscus]KAB7648501.1 16S rRNA (guanine(966)-N(2))-methyltransferase RsmD [Polymorphobacter fuscus]MQT16029.1 16S rRNA (guanine(966)-N(2))-methyltransferase RsmD [Polymorphobacter fuscus]NJC07694.1 16S rRNA (guanine966-N2)-methyltransferase [Polymorphobacter fuscus]
MRIIAGHWRGRALVAPEGAATRPTADRVREALFSMLTSRLGSFEGLRVLDGFAGTGALGLEAMSRGAAYATFVENDPAAVKALRTNIAGMKFVADVIAAPITAIGTAPLACDIILLDPPYGSGLAEPALLCLAERGWIAPHALVSVETSRKEALASDYDVLAVRDHGKARLHLLRAPG